MGEGQEIPYCIHQGWKKNDNDYNGDDPTALSSEDKERVNPKVWVSEERMVDD